MILGIPVSKFAERGKRPWLRLRPRPLLDSHPSPHPPLSQPHSPSQVLHAHLLVQTSVDRFDLNNCAMLYLFDGYVFVTFFFHPCNSVNLTNMCKLNKSAKLFCFFVRNCVKFWHILLSSNSLDPDSEHKYSNN